MKVLITGVGGFAGSHLADYIAGNTDSEIFGVLRDSEKSDNLSQIEEKVVLSTGEITDFQSIFTIIKQVKPDIIFHVAGQAFVPSSFQHAADTFKTNVIGTINVFEAVKAAEISPRIIVVTSGEIYGETFGLPGLHTEQSIPQPVNPYAASKTSMDYIAQTYKKYEGLNIVIARPFNHTGPRQRPNFVCSSIAKQIVTIQKTKAPKILRVGNIKARRDFTDVRDIAKGYWMLSQIDNKHNYIFNLCSGRIFSIEDIIHLFEEIVGEKFELNVEPKRLRGYDIQLLAGSANAMNHSVGWKAEIPFKKTLTELIEYWNQQG